MKYFFALFQILFCSFLSFSQDLPDFNFEEKEKKTIDVKYNFGIGAGVRFFNKFNFDYKDIDLPYGTTLRDGDIKNYPHFSNISITNRISFEEKFNFYANIEYDIKTIRVLPHMPTGNGISLHNPNEEVFKLNRSELISTISLSYNFHEKLALEGGVLFSFGILNQSQNYYSESNDHYHYIYIYQNNFGTQFSLRFLFNKNNNLNIRFIRIWNRLYNRYTDYILNEYNRSSHISKGNIQLIYSYFF